MPFVHVELVSGRSDEQLKAMMSELLMQLKRTQVPHVRRLRLLLMKWPLIALWTVELCVQRSN